MNLNRHQLSLLITVFAMAIVVLGLYNIHLGGRQEADEYLVEMVLDEKILEELIKEEEKTLEELQNQDPVKSHMAYNEAAKPSFGNPEPLKTLEEIIAERALNAPEETSEYEGEASDYVAKIKELAKQREETKQLLGEREAQKEERTNFLAARRTSVSYSLVNRNNYKLPPPIYTCIEGGKVVINIEVDAVGNVTNASFNEKSSGTSNGCLVENAITYALKAKFDTSSRAMQKGTITYLFQGK